MLCFSFSTKFLIKQLVKCLRNLHSLKISVKYTCGSNNLKATESKSFQQEEPVIGTSLFSYLPKVGLLCATRQTSQHLLNKLRFQLLSMHNIDFSIISHNLILFKYYSTVTNQIIRIVTTIQNLFYFTITFSGMQNISPLFCKTLVYPLISNNGPLLLCFLS